MTARQCLTCGKSLHSLDASRDCYPCAIAKTHDWEYRHGLTSTSTPGERLRAFISDVEADSHKGSQNPTPANNGG